MAERRPFKVLQIGHEYLLVFQAVEGEDKMVLVDRLDPSLVALDQVEDAYVSLHRRCKILNDIYLQWGPIQPEREDETKPALSNVEEGDG